MKYLSLLRGINVSGQKKIKMADLKALYEGLGFSQVETYIQSGNVIFESKNEKIPTLSKKISSAIENKFGFFVPVELRTSKELSAIIDALPFSGVDAQQEANRILVTFMSEKPQQADLSELDKFVKSPEQLAHRGREIYLYCPNGYGHSKLSNTFIEKKLRVQATTRNWKSVCQLWQMVN